MSSPFENPASAAGVNWEDLKGSLLIFEVTGQEHDVPTSFGPKDPIRAHLSVVDGKAAGEEYPDTLVFPTALVSQLRPSIGKKVLGRLGQGQSKPGQKPPWLLSEASPQDQKAALAYLNSKTLTAPAAAPTQSQPPF